MLTDPSGLDPRFGKNTINCRRNALICRIVYSIGYPKNDKCSGTCMFRVLSTLGARGITSEMLNWVAAGNAKITNADQGREGPGLYLAMAHTTKKINWLTSDSCDFTCALGKASMDVLGCHSQAGCAAAAATFFIPGGSAARLRLLLNAERGGRGVAVGARAAKPGAPFIAGENGVVVSTSRARLEESMSGLPSRPTTGAAGREYTLPDGSLVRIMEPSGQAPLRASFTNSKGGPINPFTGKPVQPPAGLTKAERLKYVRDRTHVELEP